MLFQSHVTRKRFGQHWLKDENVLRKIIQASDICSNDRILEIGPGKGALTNMLLETNLKSLYSIELDKSLIRGLENQFLNDTRFSVLQGDVLRLSLIPPDGNAANKVVANIPYYITGPILEKLLGRLGNYPELFFNRLVLLMQKEVADRILSQPGNSNFSALSVRIQLLAKCTDVCTVPPSCFVPKPKVTSKVIMLEPLNRTQRYAINHEKMIDRLLRVAFNLRRKKLRNTLITISTLENLQLLASKIGFTLDQRPQNITLNQWVLLSKQLLTNN
tara:strand:- start:9843 stop:10667 length:825 start_codon:yes stop_codon:yes gene_type:complete